MFNQSPYAAKTTMAPGGGGGGHPMGGGLPTAPGTQTKQGTYFANQGGAPAQAPKPNPNGGFNNGNTGQNAQFGVNGQNYSLQQMANGALNGMNLGPNNGQTAAPGQGGFFDVANGASNPYGYLGANNGRVGDTGWLGGSRAGQTPTAQLDPMTGGVNWNYGQQNGAGWGGTAGAPIQVLGQQMQQTPLLNMLAGH